jgi:phosphoribosylformylglycinamidine synthase|tara:strand:+ start:904 stop:1152 length:249 start_codon:yes stop_codon:yes gene_type:complete
MIAKIHITFKNGVLDPQGKAVHQALKDLGYNEVSEIQMGKYLELKLDGVSQEDAENRVTEMCEKLFANTVIESYRFTLETLE